MSFHFDDNYTANYSSEQYSYDDIQSSLYPLDYCQSIDPCIPVSCPPQPSVSIVAESSPFNSTHSFDDYPYYDTKCPPFEPTNPVDLHYSLDNYHPTPYSANSVCHCPRFNIHLQFYSLDNPKSKNTNSDIHVFPSKFLFKHLALDDVLEEKDRSYSFGVLVFHPPLNPSLDSTHKSITEINQLGDDPSIRQLLRIRSLRHSFPRHFCE